MHPSMQRLSLCCQSTTVAHLNWRTWPWLSVAAAPSEVATIFIRVTSTPQCSLSCTRCMSYCCFSLLHGTSKHSTVTGMRTVLRRVGFETLCFFVSWYTIENQISLTIHQGGIIGWVQLLPSRLFRLLQSSDVQPAKGLMGFGGQSE